MATTITFSEAVENHTGMEIIGQKTERGVCCENLELIRDVFIDYKTEMVDLGEGAKVLIIRNFVKDNQYVGLDDSKHTIDISNVVWDSKYYDRRRGRVLNKNARWNVCFNEKNRDPCYEQGQGRVVAWDDVGLRAFKEYFESLLYNQYELLAEGNFYHKPKSYIGWHGDSERRIVIGLRLGNWSHDLCFRWYYECKPVSDITRIKLNVGDVYIMSDKAVGNDWKKKKQKNIETQC